MSVRVAILSAALRPASLTVRLAHAVERALSATGRAEPRLREELHAAEAVVFVSPEYNGSYSGALKNAVDFFVEEWAGKPIGVAACSSGRLGGVAASVAMQSLVLGIKGYALPQKLVVPQIGEAIREDGFPQTDVVTRNATAFAEAVVWLAEAIQLRRAKV